MDFVSEETRQFMVTNRERIASGLDKEFEGTVAAKNGRLIPVLVHGSTLRDDQGHIIGNMAFITDLTEQKKSLALAGEIQKNLLPQSGPQIQGLDIAGRTAACDEIGGDYFDFLRGQDCANNHFEAVVGDVTGHGVEAALLMTTARAFWRMRASQCGAISQIITEMNRHLAMDFGNTGRFMTLFYVSIDPQNRNLAWVRAGHDPAVIYDPVQNKFEELKGTGLALGVDKNFIYKEFRKTGLARGQIIALGTDGIWESFNSAGQMFGKAQFRDIIRKNAALTAGEIIDAVFRDVNAHARGLKQADDITLVIIKIDGHPGSGEDWQI
jgi:sigma-B regulation protein RsbU (phosphoserine phosphatase)